MQEKEKNTVKLNEISQIIAGRTLFYPIEVYGILKEFFKVLTEMLARGETIKIQEFGKFWVSERNVMSGVEKEQVKRRVKKVHFQASKTLKQKVNKVIW